MGAFTAADVVDPGTGEVILESNEELTPRVIAMAQEKGVETARGVLPRARRRRRDLSQTLKKDPIRTHEEALIEIYRRLRPGDPPTLDSSRSLFENMFFNPQKYDFSRVGRLKLNTKLGLNTPLDEKILHPQDFYEVIKYLLKLRKNIALGRRHRSPGQPPRPLGRRAAREPVPHRAGPHGARDQGEDVGLPGNGDRHAARPDQREAGHGGDSRVLRVVAAVAVHGPDQPALRGHAQAPPVGLGPGGLSRERAGFEVRDVHPTHYGRICPIETPEGPNIGLISSLSCYARINEFGFIESPYRKVKNGQVVDYVQDHQRRRHAKYKNGDIVRPTRSGRERRRPIEEEGPSSSPLLLPVGVGRRPVRHRAGQRRADENRLVSERVNARQAGDFILAPREPGPVHRRLAEAAGVGRRLAHPVPRERRRQPRADGIEHAAPGGAAAAGAGAVRRHRHGVHHRARLGRGGGGAPHRRRRLRRLATHRRARRGGEEGDETREMGADIYTLTKFKRSNQNTCINQKPIVRGPEGDQGPGAGRRPLHRARRAGARPQRAGRVHAVARLQLRGRDPRQRAAGPKDDYYTSIHIEEFEIEARDTKLGPEEITRDIPNVSEGYLRDLDDSGIIRIGAAVKPGDILVGKVTPKGETQLTPEEKLLRAIFGEKAGDVRDASLICPPGIEGVIVGVKIFSRKGIEKDDRAKAIEADELDMMEKNLQDEIRILHDETKKRLVQMLQGADAALRPVRRVRPRAPDAKGHGADAEVLETLPYATWCGPRCRPTTRGSRPSCGDLEERTERQVEVIRITSKRRRRRSGAATSCRRA
jgi:DNA-directed RNA polymerase subunit beta